MTVDPQGSERGTAADPDTLLMHVRAAVRGDAARPARIVGDLLLPDRDRLDEATRLTARSLYRRWIVQTARHLDRDDGDASVLASDTIADNAFAQPIDADRPVLLAIVDMVREWRLGRALALRATAAHPSLLIRLTDHRERVIADAATTYARAQRRRRSTFEGGQGAIDLPAELFHHLVWRVASLCNGVRPYSAVQEGAYRLLSEHDEGVRVEACAVRLASALNLSPDALAPLMNDAVSQGEIPLAVAVAAQTLDIGYDDMRAIWLERTMEPLALALRAAGLARDEIARIALALCEADSARDADWLPDLIDMVAGVEPSQAMDGFAWLRTDPAFRALLRENDQP